MSHIIKMHTFHVSVSFLFCLAMFIEPYDLAKVLFIYMHICSHIYL